MELNKAKIIALVYWEKFKPYCDKIKIAGSIRRERPDCGDIEIVCVPTNISIQGKGLFTAPTIKRNLNFINLVNSLPKIKGKAEGKYCKLQLPEGITLDLFMCQEHNFGLIWMLRTGSDKFSKRMVTEIKSKGFYCYDGYLWNSKHNVIPVKNEKDFFDITGLPFVKPNLREF